jgi:dephospho-CoA kinase/inosine/xanthosine triphosphate pyrophosphatase family protein
MVSLRPTPRDLFTTRDRLLGRVYFYTSSIEKYLQARLIFDRNGLFLYYFQSRREPYHEDYSDTSANLLTRARNEVISRIGRTSLLFIEDTSLRIEALSEERDFPGLLVKHWFAETKFEELDGELRTRSNERRAIVKSDIGLHLPGLERPVLIHGETSGRVAEQAPEFSPNLQYPWLTPNTFNGWFIPDESSIPLGAMELDQSLEVDFRARALHALIDRLEEYAAALNLPPGAYRRKRKLSPRTAAKQVRLFRPSPLVYATDQGAYEPADEDVPPLALIVVGYTCAGKTTFAEYASGRHGLRLIEASSVIRSLDVERRPTDDPDGFAYAKRALEQRGYDAVAREIVNRFGDELEEAFVISGFRTLEETEFLLRAVPRARVVLVEASERTRFERHLRRGRLGAAQTLEGFRVRDENQNRFGLLRVAEDLADIRIVNEEGMESYHKQISGLLTGQTKHLSGVEVDVRPRHSLPHHQLYRCLKVLVEANQALQCDEIELRTKRLGGIAIRHNNANKVLKRVPELARRIDPPAAQIEETDSARVKYQITEGGRSFVRLIELKVERLTDAKNG